MQITKGTLVSIVSPFINKRGGEHIYPNESLSVSIELGISDIYNEYDWNFQITTDGLAIEEAYQLPNGTYAYYNKLDDSKGPITKPIKKVIGLYKQEENGSLIELKQTHIMSDLDDNKFMIKGNTLIVSKPINGNIEYYRGYELDFYNLDLSIFIDLPGGFISALYYLILSNIDLLETTEPYEQKVTSFNKYQHRIKQLILLDAQKAYKIEGVNIS